jgi:hypothetical protein
MDVLGLKRLQRRKAMRRFVLAAAATFALLAAGSLAPGRAEAMTIPAPAGIAAAVNGNSLAETVAYVCRRVWRCGPYGCGWRRSCYYTRPYYRPYRPYYRHRYYRRHYY